MTSNLPGFVYWRSIIVLVLSLSLGFFVIYFDTLQYIEKQKQIALQLASSESSILTQNLNASISLAYTLETLLREKKFMIDQEGLDSFAGQLMSKHPSISSLQYAPDGTIAFISPLEGNELAIGHDLLKDPKRNKEAFEAVEKRTLTVAGPFELIQGGFALVARLPIFKVEKQQDTFWGFSTVLIRVQDLMKASRIDNLSSKGYEWNLYRIHPDTHLPDIFYGTTDGLIEDSVKLSINAPNSEWILNIKPSEGWLSGQYWRINLGIIFCLLLGCGFAYFTYFFQKQPFLLQEQVELRTKELKEAKEVVAESEQRLSQIAENSEMWIWEMDASGLYTYCSKACEYILGYSTDEIVRNKHFYDLFHPEDRNRLKEAFFEKINGKQPLKELQNRNLSRTGEVVWLSTSGVPVLDGTGGLTGYRGAGIDITHRKKLMEEQTRTAQLAALGTVAAGVAHEINNPIQGIMNYATLVAQNPEKTDRVKDVSQRIIQESERIASITKDLLYYSKDNIVTMVISDINAQIEKALTLIEFKVNRHGIAIKAELAPDLPRIAVQPQAMQQVIINLVDNAYDALRIKDLSATEKVIDVKTKLLGSGNNKQVCIEVHDKGSGMSKGSLLRAKEAFFSTKPSSQGTGLGLSIVNDIVINHGGQFVIDSVENEYTRVQILLPIK